MGDFFLYPHEIPDQSDVDTTERNLKMNSEEHSLHFLYSFLFS